MSHYLLETLFIRSFKLEADGSAFPKTTNSLRAEAEVMAVSVLKRQQPSPSRNKIYVILKPPVTPSKVLESLDFVRHCVEFGTSEFCYLSLSLYIKKGKG